MPGQRIPFTKEDEERIASAAFWGTIAAVTSIGSALLGAALTVASTTAGSAMGQIISLTISVILGVWLYQASKAFRRVATTDVADEHYLLEGFSKLRNYFMLTGVLIIIGICLGVLVFLGALVCSIGR